MGVGGGVLSSEFCPAWSPPQRTASDKFNMPEFAWYLTGHCELSVHTSTSVFLCELGPGGGMSWALRAARGLEALAERSSARQASLLPDRRRPPAGLGLI